MSAAIPAITLWQPWADLIALGLKRFETRSWRTGYQGPIYIHAAKRKVDEDDLLELAEPIHRALRGTKGARLRGSKTFADWAQAMPLGAVVAVAELADCVRTQDILPSILDTPEREFGNFLPGRWAWRIENIRLVDPPVPCQGDRGLWLATPKTIAAVEAAQGQKASATP